ncbi:MAG: DUF2283 domain-containing protein [Moorellaceae bacterium]
MDTESLYIDFAERESVDSIEVAPGVVLDFINLSRLETHGLPVGRVVLTGLQGITLMEKVCVLIKIRERLYHGPKTVVPFKATPRPLLVWYLMGARAAFEGVTIRLQTSSASTQSVPCTGGLFLFRGFPQVSIAGEQNTTS